MANKVRLMRTSWLLLLGLDGALLARAWPVVPAAKRVLEYRGPQPAAAGVDRAFAALGGSALWLACLWLGLALLAALASASVGQRLPWVARLAGRTVPSALRRAVAVSVGASLLIGPGLPASAAPTVPSAGSVSQPPPLAPVPWPTDAGSRVGTSPASTALPSTASDVSPARSTPVLPASSTPETGSNPPELPGSDRSGSGVLVRPGDSLWLIAARRLGSTADDHHIASAWPYWYRANRRVIGSDPNLLEPGQRLVTPRIGGLS